MGRKRITQLLEQLEDNQQKELKNAAAIFTVAQVAVNQLQEQALQNSNSAIAALPPALVLLDKSELIQRFGSHTGCRQAAKQQGIRFSRTPTWEQLVVALSYAEALHQLIENYLVTNPNPELHGITFEVKIK